MTFPRQVARILVVFFMPIAVSVVCPAQTADPTAVELSNRVEKLQKELEELQTQLATLKTSPPPSTIAASQMAAPVATSNSAPSISSLLGPTSLSGFVDMYYSYNANQPASRTSSFRSFDAFSNQFALNLVELTVDKAPEATNSRTGYHLSLGYGQAINAVNGTEPGGLSFAQYLKEAYFSYLAPVGKGLQVDLGKFVTPAGAEVIETKDNWNYSRGLLFSYAIPYYHLGMRAAYSPNDKVTLTGFLFNGWNNSVDNNGGKSVGASITAKPNSKLTAIANYIGGPELNDNNK